jgi:hypothetical protein
MQCLHRFLNEPCFHHIKVTLFQKQPVIHTAGCYVPQVLAHFAVFLTIKIGCVTESLGIQEERNYRHKTGNPTTVGRI